MDYANLEFQTLDLQHQHHKCKSHKRTLFSHKEILLVFALIGALNIPRTGCDDTENFQKNSKYSTPFSVSAVEIDDRFTFSILMPPLFHLPKIYNLNLTFICLLLKAKSFRKDLPPITYWVDAVAQIMLQKFIHFLLAKDEPKTKEKLLFLPNYLSSFWRWGCLLLSARNFRRCFYCRRYQLGFH